MSNLSSGSSRADKKKLTLTTRCSCGEKRGKVHTNKLTHEKRVLITSEVWAQVSLSPAHLLSLPRAFAHTCKHRSNTSGPVECQCMLYRWKISNCMILRFLFLCQGWNISHSCHTIRKHGLRHMRTIKVQISLPICAVWSAPLLFAA